MQLYVQSHVHLHFKCVLSKSQLNAKTTFLCSKMLAQNNEKQPLIVHFWPRKVKNVAFSCDFDNMRDDIHSIFHSIGTRIKFEIFS